MVAIIMIFFLHAFINKGRRLHPLSNMNPSNIPVKMSHLLLCYIQYDTYNIL